MAFRSPTKFHFDPEDKYIFEIEVKADWEHLDHSQDMVISRFRKYIQTEGDTRQKHSIHKRKTATTKLCTVMSLVNLASPFWLPVLCHKSLLKDVLCAKQRSGRLLDSTKVNSTQNFGCSRGLLRNKTKCLGIFWKFRDQSLSDNCLKMKMTVQDFHHFQDIKFLTEASKLSPVLFPSENKTAHLTVYHFDQIKNTYVGQCSEIMTSHSGFHICMSSSKVFAVKSNLFLCPNTIVMTAEVLCDRFPDCEDGSDEKHFGRCHFFETKLNISDMRFEGKCPALQLRDINNTCLKYQPKKNGERTNIISEAIDQFTCKDGTKIDNSLLDDLHQDCKYGEDEVTLFRLLVFGTMARCNSPVKLSCAPGHSKCYTLSDLCVYKLNNLKFLTPCRNGRHVENCEHFHCNVMFKCPGYYCVPWEYACNGRWDCPLATDEHHCSLSDCSMMFQCKHTNMVCVHLGNVCDGETNCPHGDDEFVCDLKDVDCPSQCECLLFAIRCAKSFSGVSNNVYPYMYLFFKGLRLGSAKRLENFPKATFVELVDVGIQQVCQVRFNENIVVLAVSENEIKTLLTHCVKDKVKLRHLQLVNNQIEQIHKQALVKLSGLKHLNLSQNCLTHFSKFAIVGSDQLQILSLKANELQFVGHDTFDMLGFTLLEVTTYQLCCIVNSSFSCHADIAKQWFEPCGKILSEVSLEMSFISTAGVLMSLNGVSINLLFVQKKKKKYAVLAVPNHLTKVMWTLVLLTLWLKSLSHKENIIFRYLEWRLSTLCHCIAFLSLLFFLLDPLLAFLLSFSRFRMTANPFENIFKDLRKCVMLVAKIVFSVAVISLIAVSCFSLNYEAMPTEYCLLNFDPKKTFTVAAIGVICAVHEMCLGFAMGLCHFLLVKNTMQSQSQSNRKIQYPIERIISQLVMIQISYLVCWIPVNIVLTVTMIMESYPMSLIGWTCSVIVPVNGFLLPCIFLATSIRSMTG